MAPSERHGGALVACILCSMVLLAAGGYLPLAEAADGGGGKLKSVNIGALLAYNSSIGSAALSAIQHAVQMVNNDSTVLPDTKLVLSVGNTNCSAFQGASAAMDMMTKEVVAIIGPQSSGAAHFVALMGGATQVPLVTFAATDPTLSEDQYHYIVRMAHSDVVQMRALADVVGLYGWREVVAIYTEDDFGVNGITALGDALIAVEASIVFKGGLDPAVDRDGVGMLLNQVSMLEARVIVVHLNPTLARTLFTIAYELQMIAPEYVWIVTESVASILDMIYMDQQFVQAMQGVVGVRSFIADTPQLESFIRWWNDNTPYGHPGAGLMAQVNVYALNAFDAVWVIARALDTYVKQGGHFSFQAPPAIAADAGGNSDLARLNISASGPQLLYNILNLSFDGVTGSVQFDSRGDLIGSQLEIVNMVSKGVRVVGYWTNETSLSLYPPTSDPSALSPPGSQDALASPLQTIIWPGGSTIVPRGWVVPKNGKPLVIGVPNKNGYKEFVNAHVVNNETEFTGFCIDVFTNALSYLPYAVSYKFVSFGNGTVTPSYDDLIDQVVDKVFDAVVGDVTITTKRAKLVDFTQPYVASGLVVVVPTKQAGSNHAWAFMRPFTAGMWCTTGAFFLLTGAVLWLLEHKKNRDFRGRPKKQFVTTLWFIFSTLFFAQREKVKSTLGRAVLIIWLFVVLIIISSYTASLTSILTVQQLTTSIQGISDLILSTVPIGYQRGSFVLDYLMQLGVPEDRLVPLDDMLSYADSLARGPKSNGVGAVVDELPYIQLFLSSQCDFTIAGQEFTKSGWGFAFPKGSQLAIDMSTAILTLAENGKLQQIHDLWLSGRECSSGGLSVNSNELGLSTFWGLFLITGLASVLCIVLYYSRLIWQHRKQVRSQSSGEESAGISRANSSRTSFIRSLITYIEESEVVEDPRKVGTKMKKGKKVKVKGPSRTISANGLHEVEVVDSPEPTSDDPIIR